MRKLQLTIISLFVFSFSYGLNVTIIESQSFNVGHDMDTEWSSVLNGMGHTPTISPQSTLDNTSFFSSTDILIISSGVIYLPSNRINTILQFVQSGKPVYIQSEYLSTYSTNIAFASIINSLGGSFVWNNAFSGTLQPMNVIGTFSTTNNTVASLSYYWYSFSGVGDCNTINFLEYGGEYHGFQYVSPSPTFGSIITTTDQDWVRATTSIPLMENIITHLISPPSSNTTNLNLGNDTTLCQGDTLILDATTPNATYLWQDNTTNPTFSVTQQGSYWVQVTVNNCTTTDVINITYNPSPSINLGNDTTLCQGEILLLDATLPNATYLWQDNTTNPTFNVTQQGVYWVQVTNSCGSSTDTININYNPLPIVGLGNDTILCQGEILLLDATFPNATYLWQDNTTNPTLNVTQQGVYWVQVTNSCGSSTDTININYNPLPIVYLGNDTTLCQGETLLLDATLPNATYLWQDNTTNPTFNVTQQGVYWVQVTVNNCSKMDTLILNDGDCEILLEIPNVFTPNNDGINDLFVPVTSKGIVSMNTVIYNRWGNKIYETNKLSINWDGHDVSDGTYFWVILYTDIKGIKNTLKGYVTILK